MDFTLDTRTATKTFTQQTEGIWERNVLIEMIKIVTKKVIMTYSKAEGTNLSVLKNYTFL